jgi:ABC-type Mn2+/Zn2+ transport system ATPase subunit
MKILEEGISLKVYAGEKCIFESSGKWLYPLFELEEYIDNENINAADLYLHDKVAGRAAASLITGMGFKNCFIDLISKGALEVFKKHGIKCSYSDIVENIDCMTEKIITPDMNPDQVYTIIKKRAGLSKGLDLEIINLKAGYPGKIVLNGLNLSMVAGEKLVITGDNGSGKSTLMKSLIGALSLLEGKIMLGGEDIKKIRKIPSPIAYVNQNSKTDPFPLTASEIISSGLLGIKKTKSELKYKAEISMRRTGCFHLRNQNFYSLSGGEKQRVSLARCLSQEAGLILLDEPTSFLDKEAKEDLLEILNKIIKREMSTVLLVSHDHEWIKKLNWPVQKLKEGKLCLKY